MSNHISDQNPQSITSNARPLDLSKIPVDGYLIFKSARVSVLIMGSGQLKLVLSDGNIIILPVSEIIDICDCHEFIELWSQGHTLNK